MSCKVLKTLTGNSEGPNYTGQWQIWEVKYNRDGLCQSEEESKGLERLCEMAESSLGGWS